MASSDKLILGKMPDFTRPVLFLDFDDVVNVFGKEREKEGVETACVSLPPKTDCGDYLRAAADGGERIAELAWRRAVAEFARKANAVWLTSWKAYTQSALNPALGVDFGYVDWMYRGLSDSGFFGKAEAVEAVVRTYRPPAFAVADDSFYNAQSRFKSTLPGLPVKVVAPQNGLTDSELDELGVFLGAEWPVPRYWHLSYEELEDDGFTGFVYAVRLVPGGSARDVEASCTRAEVSAFRFFTEGECRAFAEDACLDMWPFWHLLAERPQDLKLVMEVEKWECGEPAATPLSSTVFSRVF